jgi:protein-S-isoprenylcysteine O-methyltransferase Ste14
MRILVLLFGVLSYLVFFATFVYQVGFIGGFLVPKTIDSGPPGPALEAVLVNTALLALFGVQHSVMARPSFKAWWARIVPAHLERSVYVLISTLLFVLIDWQWRPLPDPVVQLTAPAARAALRAISFLGWGIVLYSSFLIDHLDLFGVRQVWLHFRGRAYTDVTFRETSLYRWVRHPLMLGFLVAFWATPDLTRGHLLFAVVNTAYILIALRIEERSLLAAHGEAYREYCRRVPMLVPVGGRS